MSKATPLLPLLKGRLMSFPELVNAYAVSARENLRGPGQAEAALSAPVAALMRGVGELVGRRVVAHSEVTVVGDEGEAVRPDFGVRVDGVLTGHIELKAPGVSLDPATYKPRTHNGRQWQRLKELPNLLHTNGTEWRLWRYGKLVGDPRSLHVADLRTMRGSSVTFQAELERMLTDFVLWEPAPITSVSKLVDVLAPLTRLLREEVLDVMRDERRAVRAGASALAQPLSSLHKEWRRVLSPGADEDQFADGLAQTVVFALVLAVSEGVDVGGLPLSEVADSLTGRYGVMGRSLSLVAQPIRSTPVQTAVETITRTLSAVNWDDLGSGRSDVYLHLYEHFLSSYDPALKQASGSYYTPVELVDAMVGWADEAVREHLGRPRGLRDSATSVIDPAMGTGTYPLSVLRRVGADAAAEYGTAAAGEAVASMVGRLYGIELQSGPFSVAELRISQAVKEAGAQVPANGLRLFVADTLEDSAATAADEGLSWNAGLIAQQRIEANRVKRDENIQVVIGNPPYKDKAGGRGGWIENGVDPATGRAPLDAFRSRGNGRNERHLNNLYVYFWRWALWKAFESTAQRKLDGADQGVVCFVTATGYLTGPGFAGMREYLRRTCSTGWIINVTPEGLNPPPGHGVFAIQTPVAVGIFVRNSQASPEVPAPIYYREVAGTRAQKFAQFPEIHLNGEGWLEAPTEWRAPFTPKSGDTWSSFPSVRDLYPWYSTGLSTNRTWVYSPSPDVLQLRLNTVVAERDPEAKSVLFKESRDANLKKTKAPLPGLRSPHGEADTYQNTQVPFEEESFIPNASLVRVGYRSFDRQWVIADSRLIHDCRRPLWEARLPGQVYLTEQHSFHPKRGPGLAFSGLLPDMHHFNGRGGRVLPMLNPDGSPNLASGLFEALSAQLDGEIAAPDVTSYVAGITGHPGFVETFDEELRTPGIRVPITADRMLWNRAVELGRKVLWCHTYGLAGEWPGQESVVSPLDGVELPRYERRMGSSLPTGPAVYDESSQELRLGAGVWSHVTPAMRQYTVGGVNVIDAWVDKRSASPGGNKTSPLDNVVADTWQPEWSVEFTELLCVLARLVSLEADQAQLLGEVVNAPLLSRGALTQAGVTWPPAGSSVKPPRR
ncbi:N-6 DNA methylase [Micrococcus luteus]|uniref:type ISP restriction/modification enzyme n=1 Tax=Micrococcus luteus TaxID=1270 RepID=UPI001CA619A8|nr:type ISP restriction/modification enzyme [Micrococcus luteus]QZY84650.1 N-6 DNA methylase [Micrococcus luteus]